jgi:hypothetical protein
MPRTNQARYGDPVRATRTKLETARLFGCGGGKVDELVEDGTLQAVKVGNRTQPTVASIERALGKPIEELERHLDKPLTGNACMSALSKPIGYRAVRLSCTDKIRPGSKVIRDTVFSTEEEARVCVELDRKECTDHANFVGCVVPVYSSVESRNPVLIPEDFRPSTG